MRIRATEKGDVEMTPEEEAAFEAEVQANAKKAPPLTEAELLKMALIKKGIITADDLVVK